MIKLPQTEEQLMEYIWEMQQAFTKDLMDKYPEPKPAQTTLATLLKRLTDKKFISYKLYGNSREYYPLVQKEDYFEKHINNIVENFFDNSALRFASFFTRKSKMNKKELEELKKIVDEQLKKQ
ncbi:BlaI/MecI/CopY family transcriptional regulator [Myroides marinus]|uniref:BlaI/MecI/CopY family transcriptional regulator n=1 Tax=Myroides marinus TaxID=703342 RepID=UPI002575E40F|nr:BlaI/MecI/CopY family transcriptional regulator [Myroides marinus]MDM1369855.1 BlaI/MecI/CopY family transcriptional regulator [Myroides marinus]MDM1372514.1 BlaI/MecI/CopY family transcriptional regulator [Myroides marinus]MDM1376828.1 BlaI/MecI/CopY family transcriptional regulator [Myroides marinus]MDM1384147.1 BlaI/MecI/CopY family transcriptional regulator [Myroides marinus]MDM1389480.1 BlaI/MecI/CopY family transcriptional regulator [Myroides marinus]